MNRKTPLFAAVLAAAALAGVPAAAQPLDPSIASCLRAWGKTPFGAHPSFRTIGASVKVFGIGKNPGDTEVTDKPALILVNPGVNVMGGTTLELLNPNGWYCFRNNVNVMGSMSIRAHCKAHLASASDGVTVLGSNSSDKSVTVMGSTQIELVGCQ